MTKVFKTAILFQLILLYCFTLSFYKGSNTLTENPNTHPKSTQYLEYYSVASNTIICHTSETNNILESIQHPFSSLKYNQDNQFISRAHELEKILFYKVGRYISFSKILSVSCNSKIIIYPFHSFL
ncbi:MAG TPA: hypothetical protein PLJ60_15020 [Chryseolinea sp.]|nr:hypothetical protein [Chryseolinea sp.]HPM31645.1 hypothetical protein [Chryseolinea sp.]